ncbi:hypothetical protein [Flavobacterium pectinovorum]|nr:hypothetical protein [Flavobacterium pectinovorum]
MTISLPTSEFILIAWFKNEMWPSIFFIARPFLIFSTFSREIENST